MKIKFLLTCLIICLFLSMKNLFAAPTGTGGEQFPLGSDEGDDLNVGAGKFIVEGDTGNVGINSANPRSKLDVSGTVTATAFSGDGSALSNVPAGGWTDGGTNIFNATTTDNVGVGTSQPTGRLDIRGDEVRIWTAAGSSDQALSSGELYIEGDFEVDGTLYAPSIIGSVSVSNGWTDGGTNIFNTTTTDNVGVGTSQPTGRLDVRGDEVRIWTGAGSSDRALSSGELYVEGDLEVDGSSYFTGNVGIGTTTATAGLEIMSASGVNGLSLGVSTSNYIRFMKTDATQLDDDLLMTVRGASGTSYFVFSDDGRFGIEGTATTDLPDASLEVIKAGTTDILAVSSAVDLKGDYFVVRNDGNVGMGTTQPIGKLDVRGDEVRIWTLAGSNNNALSSGELYVEGDLEADGTIYMASCSGAGCGGVATGWTDGGTNMYNTTSTDNVGIGTTQPIGRIDVRADEVRIWTGAGSNNSALSAGELYIEGDLEVDGTAFINIYDSRGNDAIKVRGGSGTAGKIPASTSVAIPLIYEKDITLLEPDAVQAVTDAVPYFTVDAYNFPSGITITAIRLVTSASSTLTVNVEEWTSPTDGSPATIDSIATSASTETTETTITDAAVASGSYVMIDLDTTAVDWMHMTIWFYVND